MLVAKICAPATEIGMLNLEQNVCKRGDRKEGRNVRRRRKCRYVAIFKLEYERTISTFVLETIVVNK